MVFLLLCQVACAVIGGRALVLRVLPGTVRGDSLPCVVADVWAPLAIIGPMIVMSGQIGPGVRDLGWLPLGAPACVGFIALGAALLRATPGGFGAGRRLLAAAAGSGLLLVLLGGADELTVWTGQSAFAVAAVLLWMNTPPVGQPAPVNAYGSASETPRSVGTLPLLIALSCATAQSVLGVFVEGVWITGSVVIAALYAFVVVFSVARTTGPGAAVRVGGWAAALGTLLGVGALSVVHLMPQSFRVAAGAQQMVDSRVAYGFGAFALEGMILILLPAGILVLPRLGPVIGRRSGMVILAATAGIAVWRIIQMAEGLR